MAHPLNRPRFGSRDDSADRDRGLRHPAAARRRQPARQQPQRATRGCCGGDAGIDPYTRAVSDVYQDLFGEGSFIGKGIYDVDAFERALGGRLPENRILSHDLLEGCYARSGLLSDVQLIEDPPCALRRRRERAATAGFAATGRSRLALAAPRLLHGAAPARPRSARSAQPAVGAVAVEDLRQPAAQPDVRPPCWRCCCSPGVLLPGPGCGRCVRWRSWRWCRCWPHGLDLLRRLVDRLTATRAGQVATPAGRQALHVLLALACLPHEAAYSLDAIAAHAVARAVVAPSPAAVAAVGRRAAGAPTPAACATCWPRRARCRSARCWPSARPPRWRCCGRRRWPWRAPVLLLWLLSPVLVWWLDRPLQRERATLSDAQNRIPAPAGAPHLGLLRNLRRARRPPPAARQRAGTTGGSASRTAPRRPTSASRCWPT